MPLQSALTGESTPVHATRWRCRRRHWSLDRRNIVFRHIGKLRAMVLISRRDRRRNRILGEIHRPVGAAEVVATPLTAKLAWFSKFLTIAILGLAALTFGGLLRRQDAAETFTAAIALAVGAILKVCLCRDYHLAIGMARMAKLRGHSTSTRGGNAGQHHGHLRLTRPERLNR